MCMKTEIQDNRNWLFLEKNPCSENRLFPLSSGRITFYTQPPEDRSTISATICTELGEAFDINAGTLQGVCVSVHVLQGVRVSVHVLQGVWVSVHVTRCMSVHMLQGGCGSVHVLQGGRLCVLQGWCLHVARWVCMLQGGCLPVHVLQGGCMPVHVLQGGWVSVHVS